MINIKHQKVASKPPIGICSMERRMDKEEVKLAKNYNASNLPQGISETLKKPEFFVVADTTSKEIDTMIKNIGIDIQKIQATSDFNQNVIQPNSCSFDQLCSMINDLEQNVTGHGTSNVFDEKISYDTTHLQTANNTYSNKQLQPERDYSIKQRGSSPSTYEDIMTLLEMLDNDGHLAGVANNQANVYSKDIRDTPDNQCIQCCNTQGIHSAPSYFSETLREDLATVKLQLEERDGTVELLKNELKAQRRLACEKLESQTKKHAGELQAQKTKYQTVIKRHQKFIEQIISEKKDLTEKCNALTEHIKQMEVKYQREMKVAAERHGVELQKARELCAASEKIRRERWLEAKTSKIKEMTVKGLEPELRSMIEQHQQELQEIRSAHIKELQDTELRTIRRSNQQLEQLRLELTSSHEKLLSNEKDLLKTRYNEKFEQQDSLYQDQRRKLIDDLEREKKILAQEQQRLTAERDAAISQANSQCSEKINTLMRQNQIEKKNLQESLRIEQETWMENYRRQQNTKLEKMESRLRNECSRERDRQIELAIERLEKETLEMKNSLQQSSENRLRCMKEKYEAELEDASNSEQLLKSKVTSMQERLTETTIQLQKTEEKLQQCMLQLNNSTQIVDQLTIEKNNAKKIVRQEIESEKRELEDKIASLYKELTENNSNRDVQMAQLYSRVKLLVTQKDLTIGKLLKEAEESQKKCDHLEKLLDQQRKDYVLKSL